MPDKFNIKEAVQRVLLRQNPVLQQYQCPYQEPPGPCRFAVAFSSKSLCPFGHPASDDSNKTPLRPLPVYICTRYLSGHCTEGKTVTGPNTADRWIRCSQGLFHPPMIDMANLTRYEAMLQRNGCDLEPQSNILNIAIALACFILVMGLLRWLLS